MVVISNIIKWITSYFKKKQVKQHVIPTGDKNLHIKVVRYKHMKDCTFGKLYINGEFECHTLEDEYREVKVWGKTRIPEGTYDIKLRREGKMHIDYARIFKDVFHDGMIWLQDVPNFKWIYIHCGNTSESTRGCLLVGKEADIKNKRINYSRKAYRLLYPKIREAIKKGKKVTIEIK